MSKQLEVAVVGATGVLGRNVVPRLLEHNYQVRAIVRNPDAAEWLRALGVVVHRGDLLDLSSLRAALRGCSIAMHLATAIPRSDERAAWYPNDRIRREGTRNLLEACRQSDVNGYIQQSIAVLQAHGASWSHEDSPLKPNERTASAADMEKLVVHSDLDWCILRGGYFYGPGTRSDLWVQQARDRTLTLPSDGNSYVSLIHVSDMAAAVVRAIDCRVRKRVLCVVDDEPVTYRDLLGHVAAIHGMVTPVPSAKLAIPSFRVSNQCIRHVIGWRPHYATYRSGLLAT